MRVTNEDESTCNRQGRLGSWQRDKEQGRAASGWRRRRVASGTRAQRSRQSTARSGRAERGERTRTVSERNACAAIKTEDGARRADKGGAQLADKDGAQRAEHFLREKLLRLADRKDGSPMGLVRRGGVHSL